MQLMRGVHDSRFLPSTGATAVMIKRSMARACATAALFAVALLSAAQARAQDYTMSINEVTEVFASVPVGTVPTLHPSVPADFSQFAIARTDDDTLSFIEGDTHIYEISVWSSDGSMRPPSTDYRIELLGHGGAAYAISVGSVSGGLPAIPPESSLWGLELTLTASNADALGDLLKIRTRRDPDTTPAAPATLRISLASSTSGTRFVNLPLEFTLSMLERVNVNVETFVSRADANSAALELIEDNDASGFLRVSLRHADDGARYLDAAGGVGTLTLTFDATHGFGGSSSSVLCLDDLSGYQALSLDLCVRPVAGANYTLSAEGGALHMTYRREGSSVFWLEVVAPEDSSMEQTSPVYFSIDRLPESPDGVSRAFVRGRSEGVISVIDSQPTLHDLRVDVPESVAWASSLTLTLRLSGFDQYGDPIDILGVDEVSATFTAGARLASFEETASTDGTMSTLTLALESVPRSGEQVTIILRVGDAVRIEPLEKRVSVVIAAPYIYGLRDITALNQGKQTHDAVTRGSGPPLDAGAVIEVTAGGDEVLLEFYTVQMGFGDAEILYFGMGFDGTPSTVGHRFRYTESPFTLRYPNTPVPWALGFSRFTTNDHEIRSGDDHPTIIRIAVPPATTSVAVFGVFAQPHSSSDPSLRSVWPAHNLPVWVTLRATVPPPEISVHPVVSAVDNARATEDSYRSLDTATTMEAPTSVATFAIGDGGDDRLDAPLKNLSVHLTPAGGVGVDDLEATLRAFTFVMRNAHAEAPESARINATLNLVRDGDALRLEKEFNILLPGTIFRTPQPIVPNGERVIYEIVAYHSDASVRIDESVGFRAHFAADSFRFVGGSAVESVGTTVGFNVGIDVVFPPGQVVVGFVKDLYDIAESQQASVCVGVLSGAIPSDAGDLILTLTADDGSSTAERGADYTFAPVELAMNAANMGDQCTNVAIIDDNLPENAESLQINLSAAFRPPNEAPLSVSPSARATTIEIADDDKIRVRVEAGRLDDSGVFGADDVATESAADADPLLLRVSFWTDEEPPRPFSDNLGGERTVVLNLVADTDTARFTTRRGACLSASELTGSEDVCISRYGDDADINPATRSLASPGFNFAMSADYARNGRHEFYVEILARLDEEVEGEETLTFAATMLFVQDAAPDLDAAYIADPRNTTFAIRVADGESPEVRYFLTATDEQVSSLNVPEGATPATSFHAGIYDKNTGAALALIEAFSFKWFISGSAGSVISVTAGDGTSIDPSTGGLIFTFPAGAATTLSFALQQSAEDDDSVSEQGTLSYLRTGGAANIEHAANFAVIAVDNDDRVSPSACVGAIDSIDDLLADENARDAAQANCLRVRESETGAFGFTLEWDAARDRQDVGPGATALTALLNPSPYRVYLLEQAAGACPPPPSRPPPRQTVAGLMGGAVQVGGAYPAGYTLAVDAVSALRVVIDEAADAAGGAVAIKAETRYCAILRVTDGAWVDWAPRAVEVRTIAYSPADADGNGVPDHLQLGVVYADLDAYLSAQCAAQTSLSDYDCDGDDVPDALELRFGRAEDVRISPMALNCRANGLRTRLATDLPSLTCSGATAALDAISDQTLVHAAENGVPAAEPGGVAVSVGDPDALGEEMFPPGRYWLSGDTIDSVVNLGLERGVEISAPEVTALDADLIVRGRGLGAKLNVGAQRITVRLSHSTPVETIQAGGPLSLGDPPQIGAVASGVTNFRLGDLSPLLGRTEVTEMLLRATWIDEVSAGLLEQRIRISRPGTTATLFAPSSEAGMLSIAGGGMFRDDDVLTLSEESSAQTLAVSVDSRPSVSADKWTLTVVGADPTMAPVIFTDSTDTRQAGLMLDAMSLALPLRFLHSLDLTLPARLLISWSGEESDAEHGAHAVMLLFAPGTTPTAAAKAALLDGYGLGGHYRDGETPREVRPEPGVKIRLGDYAAQRCLQEADVCSGREELPDRGLGLSVAGAARHPACPPLGGAALPCLDFQLFCDANVDECMRDGAVDVVFPLSAPLRADHWLYYTRLIGGERRVCPFVQTGMPAHVAARAASYAQDGCPGIDTSATPAAFRTDPVYPDRIYAAPGSTAAACPPLGSLSWRSLAEMQDARANLSTVSCLRAAYSDNGPNDSAPETALIADPMGVGVPGGSADGFDPLAGNFGSGGGGGALGVFALLALALLTLISLPLRSGGRCRRGAATEGGINFSPPASAGGDVAAKRRQRGGLAKTLATLLTLAPRRGEITPISPRRGEKRQLSRRLKLPQRGGLAKTLAIPILLALTLGAAPQARAADWKVFDDIGDFFGDVFSGDFFTEGAWATGLDFALSGFDRDISGVQEDADDNDYGFRLRGHWDRDGVWGEGLAAEAWWADLGSAALRPDGGGEEVDFDYEAYGLGLTWGWALPRLEWLSIGGFDLNPNHVFAGGGWREIDVADADGDGVYFTTGLSWNVGEWFNAPAEQWSLRVSYDVFDSEGVDYFAIGLSHRFGTAARPAARRGEASKRVTRRARRDPVPSCGEWDACACQRLVNKDARGWYVQVATYSDNGLAVARKRMRQLREAGYREVGLRDNGRGLHALRVSVRGDCREAEALKGRLDQTLSVDSMLRGWKDRPY